jgi:hypothetical protein
MSALNQNQVLDTFVGRKGTEQIEIEVKHVALSGPDKTPSKDVVNNVEHVFATGRRTSAGPTPPPPAVTVCRVTTCRPPSFRSIPWVSRSPHSLPDRAFQ